MEASAREVTPARSAASFRDPSGFVFTRERSVFRQVNERYAPHYDSLLASGLYDELVSEALLVPHAEEPRDEAPEPGAYRVLRPRKIAFVSYPYEWCFSQLRDAALTTLRIQQRALAKGMTLKDASAYNILFEQGRPIHIDTLSFEIQREGAPWIAYRQFCQHFLAPLFLMMQTGLPLNPLLRVHLDGVPLEIASALLPRRSWMRPAALLHVHLHARSIRKHSGTADASAETPTRQISARGLRGLVDSLVGSVERLEWAPPASEWGHYDSSHNYVPAAVEQKKSLVREYVERLRAESVWDLGANTGVFSRAAVEAGANVIAFDLDAVAVERNYRTLRSQSEKRLLPLVMDLTNPSPALGWGHAERASLLGRGPCDACLALALIHHLAIGNNVPLGMAARFFGDAGRNLIIEWVPKSDPQVQRLLSSREDIFPDYTREAFEKEFRNIFEIIDQQEVEDTGRILYLMRGR